MLHNLIKHFFICLSLTIFFVSNTYSQVTIGSDKAPAKAGLLQIKDQEPDIFNQTSITGGLILPRVVLEDINTLKPFIGSSNIDYSSQKKLNTGLLVYNVSASNGFHPGVYYWDGESWIALAIVEGTNQSDSTTINLEQSLPNNVTDPTGLTLSNSYIVKPGDVVNVPVTKAYSMWNQVLDANQPNTSGTPSAELLWQDTQGLISTVELVEINAGIKAMIKVKTNTIGLNGNALIGFKIDNAIRWSWHLWITDYNPNASNVTMGNGAIFMDRNLGSIANIDGNMGTHGLFYQWGRKDPFPRAASNITNAPDQNLYNIDGANITILKNPVIVDNNLGNSVINPLIFYTAATSGDWVSQKTEGRNDALWGVTKSPYDPCPKGWHVPASGDGTASPWSSYPGLAFGNSTGISWGTGKYYPASGRRSHTDGTLNEVGAEGNVWTATAKANVTGSYSLLFRSYYTEPSAYWLSRANGFSVRCAKE